MVGPEPSATLETSTTTNDPTGRLPSLSIGILTARAPWGGVAYDLVNGELSFVNPSAMSVLHACRNGFELEALLAEWVHPEGPPVDELQTQVDAALADFAERGLVGRTTQPIKTYPNATPIDPPEPGEASTTQVLGAHRLRFCGANANLITLVADRLGLTCEGDPTAQYRIIEEANGSIRLVTDTEWHFADAKAMASTLIAVVNDFVARTTTDVVLHAAGLRSPKGNCVVFPAEPGSGKSTLAALLTQQGWAYGADESVTIRTDDLAFMPCAKPIGLDATSCVALGIDPALAGDVPIGDVARDATVLTGVVPGPQVIVIPRYVGCDGTPTIDRVESTDALVSLVASTLNLRYVGDPGLDTLVRLATTVPTYRITYRDNDEALRSLAELA